MKKNFLLAVAALLLLTTACKKDDLFGDKEKLDFNLNCTACISTEFDDPYNYAPDLTQYILEPIERDATCGHITSGYVKYLRDGRTVALVNYGHGENNAWAVKKLYSYTNNGSGKNEKQITDCKFKQSCTTNSNLAN